MQKRKQPAEKSTRHVAAARARWRAAEARALAEAAEFPVSIPTDCRQAFDLPLAHLGFLDLRIEPRAGYVSWRAIDAVSGQVLRCAALKELLRWVAHELPRMAAARTLR